MEDKLLAEVFSSDRWTGAIDVGVGKEINKTELRKMCDPEMRAALYLAIRSDNYAIAPPHAQIIPKDNGDFRTVYINENVDRLFLSIVNDTLMEMCSSMIHPSCKSYQKGIGCGKVVQKCSEMVASAHGLTIGFKSDLSKYFDSVPIQFIDQTFDRVERITGKSKIIDVLRNYYHQNTCFDVDGKVTIKYMSLMQGCAVAAFLADALLYDMDAELSLVKGSFYVRYSDDVLFIGEDYKAVLERMKTILGKFGLKLNPKKVELIDSSHWFKFLGFSIRGSEISISKGRLKKFQSEIESRTVKNRNTNFKQALDSVNRFLYIGDGTYSWATSVLPIINNKSDIDTLNEFIMDCLRATQTHKTKVGGLGYVKENKNGCVVRGRGRNVTANRNNTEVHINGYYSITCMRNAILISRPVYECLVSQM